MGEYLRGIMVGLRSDMLDKRVEVYIGMEQGEDVYMAQPLVLNKVEAGVSFDAPTFKIERDQAQRLLNDLWNMGFRPPEYAGEGVVAAMREHIATLKEMMRWFQSREHGN